ncbi:cyclic nucleotide-binding protein [Cytophagales bacterium WSM2-2]|nr:cyclic nucleotide-binding protein [Cytophagales bacterium WSM2-2]
MQKHSDLFFQVISSVVPGGVDEGIAEFASYFEAIQLKTDDFFVREGTVCSRIGFIQKGMIRHYYIDDDVETTRWVSVEGEFITGLGSYIRQKPCNHNLQAIAPTELWVISKSNFDKAYQNSPAVRQLWLHTIEELCLGFEDRIYTQLSSDAEKRYLYMMEKWPQIIEKVPQKYIASMMGIKPESLSRLRAKLTQQRIS